MNLSSFRAMVGVSMFDSLVGRDAENRIVPQLAVFLLQQVDIYATRDRLAWTPRPDQWMPLQDAALR